MTNKQDSLEAFVRQYPIPVIFGLCLLVAVLLILTKGKPEAADTSEQPRAVETMSVKLATLSPAITIFVKVSTPNHAQLRSAVTADVAALNLLEGAKVTKGGIIISLDDQEPRLILEQRRADVLEARARIAEEKLDHENELFVLGNVKKLSANGKRNRDNIIKEHKIKLSQLNAQLLRAESALQLAQLDLDRTRIRSPFDGRISKLHVSTGDRVRPGDLLAEVYDLNAIELRGPVTTRYVGAIQKGLNNGLTMKGQITIDNGNVTTRLDRLSGVINDKSGSVDAIFNLPAGAPDLPLGRSLELTLQLSPVSDTFSVPPSALYGVDTIYKVVNQRLKSISVTRLGDFPTSDGQQHILLQSNDVKQNDIILVTQIPYAVDNLLVKPIKP